MSNTGGKNLETRTLLDEFRNFDKEGFLDLGHPLLNRIAESFVKAAGVRIITFTFSFSFYITQVSGQLSRTSNNHGPIPPLTCGSQLKPELFALYRLATKELIGVDST